MESSINTGFHLLLDGGILPSAIGTNLDPGFWDSGDSNAPTSFSNYIKPSYGRPASVQQWNLQVQQELTKDLIRQKKESGGDR